SLHVVIWRIGLYVLVIFLFAGIAPFPILSRSERYLIVQHCRDHIDKRNRSDDSMEEIWTHVDRRANQQSTCAATPGIEMFRGRIFLLDQIFGSRNEIGEGVAFVHQPAFFVPIAAHLASAANMSECVDEAPVDKA